MVRNAVLDKGVVVPDGARIGVDLEWDRAHYTVSDDGIVVLGKNQLVTRLPSTWVTVPGTSRTRHAEGPDRPL